MAYVIEIYSIKLELENVNYSNKNNFRNTELLLRLFMLIMYSGSPSFLELFAVINQEV
jgi:hypothetical protein